MENSSNDIIAAIMLHDLSRVTELLQQGVSPNYAEDSENMTLLHIAVSFNAVDILKLLISEGGNVYVRTAFDGQTPLELAKCLNNKCLELLKNNGTETL